LKKKVFEVYQTINGVSKANEGFWDSENFFGAPEKIFFQKNQNPGFDLTLGVVPTIALVTRVPSDLLPQIKN